MSRQLDVPAPTAPLVDKVQYLCTRLEIDDCDLMLAQVVDRITQTLKLNGLADMHIVARIECCLDACLDRTSHARPPSTPSVDEVQAKANAQVLANGEAAWKAMLEARKKNAATGVGSSKVITEGRVAPPLPVGGGRSFDDTEAVKRWLREHGVAFSPYASLADLEALAAEEQAAIDEEEAAMAEYNQAMTSRGRSSVVTAISTSGTNMTVLDTARAGEEQARQEMIAMAEAAAARPTLPVVAGTVVTGTAVEAGTEETPVVVQATAVAVPVDDNENRPVGGISALANAMRIS